MDALAWFVFAFLGSSAPNKITSLGFSSLTDCGQVAAIYQREADAEATKLDGRRSEVIYQCRDNNYQPKKDDNRS